MLTESYSTASFKVSEEGAEATLTGIHDASDEWRDCTKLTFSNGRTSTVVHGDAEPAWLPLIRTGDVVPLRHDGYIDVPKLGVYLTAHSPTLSATDTSTCYCGATVDEGTRVRCARGRILRCEICDPDLHGVEVLQDADAIRDDIEAEYWALAARAGTASRARGLPTTSPQAWAEVTVVYQESMTKLAAAGGPLHYADGQVVRRCRPRLGVVHGALDMPTTYAQPHPGETGLSLVQERLRAASTALVVCATGALRDQIADACDLDTPGRLDRQSEDAETRGGRLKSRRIATCLPSLRRVAHDVNREPAQYEVLVLPNLFQLRCALTKHEHSPAAWRMLGEMIASARHVVVLEPYLTDDDRRFVEAWRDATSVTVRNEHVPLAGVDALLLPTAMDVQRHAVAAANSGKRVAIFTSGPGTRNLEKRLMNVRHAIAIVGRDEITNSTRVLIFGPSACPSETVDVDEAYIVGFGAPSAGRGFAPHAACQRVTQAIRAVRPQRVLVGIQQATASLVVDAETLRAEIEHDKNYARHRGMRRCGAWKPNGGRQVRCLDDRYDQAYSDHYVRAVIRQNIERSAGVDGIAALLRAAGARVATFDESAELMEQGLSQEAAEETLRDVRAKEAHVHLGARNAVERERVERVLSAPSAPTAEHERREFLATLHAAPATDVRDAALERHRIEYEVLAGCSLHDLPSGVADRLVRRHPSQRGELCGRNLELAHQRFRDYRAVHDGGGHALRRRHSATVARGYSPHLDRRLPLSEALVSVLGAITAGRVDHWRSEWTELKGSLFVRASGYDLWTDRTDKFRTALDGVTGGVAAIRTWIGSSPLEPERPARLLAVLLRALGAEMERPRTGKHGGVLRLSDGRVLDILQVVPRYVVEPSCWTIVGALVGASETPPTIPSSRSIAEMQREPLR